jgi:hypothetical protein
LKTRPVSIRAKALITNRVRASLARRLGLIGWAWAAGARVAVILEPFLELFEQVFYLEQDYKEPPTFCQAFVKSFENVFDLGPNLE